jgi:hypothetical protein
VSSRCFEVTDDSGFLALVDPQAYEGFVDEDWELEELIDRFRREMAAVAGATLSKRGSVAAELCP